MMDEQTILAILNRLNAVITGNHVVYTSGKHGSEYVNKDAIYPHTTVTSELCKALASRFAYYGVEVVIAPAVGGVILSQWIAFHLKMTSQHDVLSVYADKEGESFVIKRGYDKLIKGKRVLIVEDVLTTGGSVQKVVRAVRELGCEIVGVGALCNRGGITAEQLEVSFLHSLVNVSLESWDEADCPMCKDGVPINTDVGKGKEFLARRAELGSAQP